MLQPLKKMGLVIYEHSKTVTKLLRQNQVQIQIFAKKKKKIDVHTCVYNKKVWKAKHQNVSMFYF